LRVPLKDSQAKNAYQRKWYAAHRERVIAKVAKRKRESYAGVCLNCGGPTIGQSPGKAARYCKKTECRKEQWKEKINDGYRVKRSRKETEDGIGQ
jgi:hypothetical protein